MFTKHNIFKDSNLQYLVLEILNNQDPSIKTLKYNVKFVQSNNQQGEKTFVHI
jgi:protein-tyrosine phosphatase